MNSYSYEDHFSQLLVKSVAHFHKRVKARPLTPRDPFYDLALAYGVFLPSRNHSRYLSQLHTESRNKFSDFGEINIYFVQGTSELATKDLAKLANYAAAVSQYILDICTDISSYQPMSNSLGDLITLKSELIRQLKNQVDRREGDIIDSYIDQETLEGDPDQSTTWEHRFRMALALLCGNHLPDERLCRLWRDENEEIAHAELQGWVVSHCILSWATGVGAIEAAISLADTPDEGGDHED